MRQPLGHPRANAGGPHGSRARAPGGVGGGGGGCVATDAIHPQDGRRDHSRGLRPHGAGVRARLLVHPSAQRRERRPVTELYRSPRQAPVTGQAIDGRCHRSASGAAPPPLRTVWCRRCATPRPSPAVHCPVGLPARRHPATPPATLQAPSVTRGVACEAWRPRAWARLGLGLLLPGPACGLLPGPACGRLPGPACGLISGPACGLLLGPVRHSPQPQLLSLRTPSSLLHRLCRHPSPSPVARHRHPSPARPCPAHALLPAPTSIGSDPKPTRRHCWPRVCACLPTCLPSPEKRTTLYSAWPI